MAPDPLARIWAKFGRAKDHRDAFDVALDRWLDTNPYSILGHADPASGWFEVRLVAPDLPLGLALTFSDFVTNLRACLDHLIFHLTTINGRDPDDRSISFPVVSDRKDWKSSLGSNLKDFPGEWTSVVEEAQPYHAGTAYKQHPLYLIHHMDIRNKHRLLLPFVLTAFGFEPGFEMNRAAKEGDAVVNELVPVGSTLMDGMLLARLRCISQADDLHIVNLVNKATHCEINIGPASGVTDFAGRLPNLLVFVGSMVEALSPAF
jgi:hypothetical protein